jgi:hypothetical protein
MSNSDEQAGRRDLTDAVVWLVLGFAIVIFSLRMDRLEDQDINPYTIPGLLPGLLGLVLMLLGGLLLVRSLRAGAWAVGGKRPIWQASNSRLVLVIGLCVAFATVMVGHGLPFWAAAAAFVTASILSLQHYDRRDGRAVLSIRSFSVAAFIGIGAGVAVTTVFQGIFLVRLP